MEMYRWKVMIDQSWLIVGQSQSHAWLLVNWCQSWLKSHDFYIFHDWKSVTAIPWNIRFLTGKSIIVTSLVLPFCCLPWFHVQVHVACSLERINNEKHGYSALYRFNQVRAKRVKGWILWWWWVRGLRCYFRLVDFSRMNEWCCYYLSYLLLTALLSDHIRSCTLMLTLHITRDGIDRWYNYSLSPSLYSGYFQGHLWRR